MSRRTAGGYRRGRRVADLMTPELYACVERSPAAERAGEGEVEAADHGYVGAAALNVGAFDDLRRRMVRTDEPYRYDEWAARVDEPARGRLLELARLGRSAK